uniref:Uncharacterized protein n=2 Tax=Caenorhabditis japonica TaxID=281687 RepID=A0A8R1E6N1_CAEJA
MSGEFFAHLDNSPAPPPHFALKDVPYSHFFSVSLPANSTNSNLYTKMPKKTQEKKKLQLSNKQFEDLLKEIGGGLPEGLALDPTLLAALRQATDEQFNKVAVEKFGAQVHEEACSDDENSKSEQEQQPSSSQNS